MTLVPVFCKLFVHDQYDALVNVHRNFMNKHVPNFHSFNHDTTVVIVTIVLHIINQIYGSLSNCTISAWLLSEHFQNKSIHHLRFSQ